MKYHCFKGAILDYNLICVEFSKIVLIFCWLSSLCTKKKTQVFVHSPGSVMAWTKLYTIPAEQHIASGAQEGGS